MMKLKKPLRVIPLVLLACAAVAPAANHQRASRAAELAPAVQQPDAAGVFNVRAFGARGDGHALDSPAVNRALDAPPAAGAGTVRVLAAAYRRVSIRLQSNLRR